MAKKKRQTPRDAERELADAIAVATTDLLRVIAPGWDCLRIDYDAQAVHIAARNESGVCVKSSEMF